ncbi:MAG: DUF4340 domain-containing protein [Ruminococcus sp.]|nr:DUF4340 domain-containing protein [Ruminococcus sp.]
MKKAVIAIAALLIASGISIGAFIAVKSRSENENQKQAEILADNELFKIDSDSIGKIEIEVSGENYTIENDGSKWIMTASSSDIFTLDQVKIQGICTFISSLTADASYGSADDENKIKYGLDNPYKVTVYEEETPHTLYIGKQSPTGGYYYACTDNKPNIYAIQSADATEILSTRQELKDKNLIPYSESEIIGLELKKDGETVYTLSCDEQTGVWKLPEEYELLTVDQTAVSSVLTLMTRVTAVEILPETDEDFTKYGFDNPIAEFTVKASDGSQRTLFMSRYGQNADTYTHVYIGDCHQVATYYAGDLKFINQTYFDFIMNRFECSSINETAEFEISGADFSDSFTINISENKAECRGNEVNLGNAEIFSYFENFFNRFSYIGIADIDVEAEPVIEYPLLSVHYKFNNGTEKSVDLVQADDEYCYIFIDGEYTGSLASTEFITGSDSVFSAYEILCRQAGIETNIH